MSASFKTSDPAASRIYVDLDSSPKANVQHPRKGLQLPAEPIARKSFLEDIYKKFAPFQSPHTNASPARQDFPGTKKAQDKSNYTPTTQSPGKASDDDILKRRLNFDVVRSPSMKRTAETEDAAKEAAAASGSLPKKTKSTPKRCEAAGFGAANQPSQSVPAVPKTLGSAPTNRKQKPTTVDELRAAAQDLVEEAASVPWKLEHRTVKKKKGRPADPDKAAAAMDKMEAKAAKLYEKAEKMEQKEDEKQTAQRVQGILTRNHVVCDMCKDDDVGLPGRYTVHCKGSGEYIVACSRRPRNRGQR